MVALALARLQSSSPANPVLDVITQVSGALVDVYALEYQIFDATAGTGVQVYPVTPGDMAEVDLTADRLGLGHYVADWSVPSGANLGAHYIKWFVQTSSDALQQTFNVPFDVIAVGAVAPDTTTYCTVADMRSEGYADTTKYPDAFLQAKIVAASRFIDAMTGRFFFPKYMTLPLDGRGGNKLLLSDPIIAIESVTLTYAPFTDLLQSAEFRIYNRHITQNLTDPDDRDNPKVEFLDYLMGYRHHRSSVQRFYLGSQNVQVIGWFGYTDFDSTPRGRTPAMISHVCKLLVARNMNTLARGGVGIQPFRITQETTRDQQVSYTPMAFGNFTGDPEIDNILSMFLRPPALGSV